MGDAFSVPFILSWTGIISKQKQDSQPPQQGAPESINGLTGSRVYLFSTLISLILSIYALKITRLPF